MARNKAIVVWHPYAQVGRYTNMAQHKQIFELDPGIFVMLPTNREDLPAKIRVRDPPSGTFELPQRNPVLCPKVHLNAVCSRLRAGDTPALTAVACHAFGNEMPKRCGDCKDGPFGSCVVTFFIFEWCIYLSGALLRVYSNF